MPTYALVSPPGSWRAHIRPITNGEVAGDLGPKWVELAAVKELPR